jgi:hypothetical protein
MRHGGVSQATVVDATQWANALRREKSSWMSTQGIDLTSEPIYVAFRLKVVQKKIYGSRFMRSSRQAGISVKINASSPLHDL